MPDSRSPRHSGPTSRPGGTSARSSGQGGRQSGASHRSLTMKQRLVAAFTERLPFKATALFFALVLWLIVSAEEPTSGQVPVRFAPVVDTSLDLVGQLPDVSAYVVGTRSDLLRLTTSPPSIHFSVPANSPDTLRVRLDTLELTMPSGVNVSVRRVQPDEVTLRFESEMRRWVPVRSALRFEADSGWVIAGSHSFAPESVQVIGSRRRVRELEAVATIATDLIVRDTTSVLVPLDTSGLGVRVMPTQVRVRIPIAPDTVLPDTVLPDTSATAFSTGAEPVALR